MQLISISSVRHRQSIKSPDRWCNVTQCSPAASRFFIFCVGPVSCILQAGQTRLKSHLSALTTQPAWRHVTGSQQEEVIERVTEEESCRWRGRRRRKEWQRGLAGEETAEWMSMHSFIGSQNREWTWEEKVFFPEGNSITLIRRDIKGQFQTDRRGFTRCPWQMSQQGAERGRIYSPGSVRCEPNPVSVVPPIIIKTARHLVILIISSFCFVTGHVMSGVRRVLPEASALCESSGSLFLSAAGFWYCGSSRKTRS